MSVVLTLVTVDMMAAGCEVGILQRVGPLNLDYQTIDGLFLGLRYDCRVVRHLTASGPASLSHGRDHKFNRLINTFHMDEQLPEYS